MTQKDKDAVIAALEELKGDGTGLVAMTVEDCIAVVNGLPVSDGWIAVTERLPDLKGEICHDEDLSTIAYDTSDWVWGLSVTGFLQQVRYEVGPVFQGWYNRTFNPCVITYWMPLSEQTKEG
ncbi:MAG: hypothetical protein IJA75_00475 [Oscillospiraceae bacterium]|nr:hypothetical protein [Oscillospiraceae bacterium]